jgi:cellulose synthase/poly-beta-1,6-N-acetylglucosamine synthase-like glycosyltransferase
MRVAFLFVTVAALQVPQGENEPSTAHRLLNNATSETRNPFPSTRGLKVIWAYFYMLMPHVTVEQMLQQKVNYVCLSFGDLQADGTFVFPGGGCNTQTCIDWVSTHAVDWTRRLHEAGVTISISLGGAHANLPSETVDTAQALSSFQQVLTNLGIAPYIDGIDFDWEDNNVAVASAVNRLAPVFKNAGYVVTGAPMASQFQAGCGMGENAGRFNEWSLVDHTNIDGILLQWYQPGCIQLGHCPKAMCGTQPNSAGCLDTTYASAYLNRLSTDGSCYDPTAFDRRLGRGATEWATCTAGTCKQFPLEKIAIGSSLYYDVAGLSASEADVGQFTAANMLSIDAATGNKLLGAGAWSINQAVSSSTPAVLEFFPTLAASWSVAPTAAPTPMPTTAPTSAPTVAPTPNTTSLPTPPTTAPSKSPSKFPTFSPTKMATNPTKPAFVGTAFELSSFTVKTDMEDGIIGSKTIAPTDEPTVHPTHEGYMSSTEEQTVAVVRVEFTMAVTPREAIDPVMTSALTLGLASALGLNQDQVGLTHVDGVVVNVRRRQLQYTSRQLAASARTRFEIESASDDVTVVDQLRTDVKTAASEGAIVANIQKAASDRGVLTAALNAMKREQVLFSADVTVGAITKTVDVQIRPGTPTPSPTLGPITPTTVPTAGPSEGALDWCDDTCWTAAGGLTLVLTMLAIWCYNRKGAREAREAEIAEGERRMSALARMNGGGGGNAKKRQRDASNYDSQRGGSSSTQGSRDLQQEAQDAFLVVGGTEPFSGRGERRKRTSLRDTEKKKGSFWRQRSTGRELSWADREDQIKERELKLSHEAHTIRRNLYDTARRHNKKISRAGAEKIETIISQLSQGMLEVSQDDSGDGAGGMVEDFDPVSLPKYSQTRTNSDIRYTSINCQAGVFSEAARFKGSSGEKFELRTINKNTRRAQERAQHRHGGGGRGDGQNPSYNLDLAGNLKHQRMKYVFVITMYEESPLEVKASLDGVHRNVDELVQESIRRRKTIGDSAADREGLMNGWESACVCIVADGLHNFKRTMQPGYAGDLASKTKPLKASNFDFAYGSMYDEALVDPRMARVAQYDLESLETNEKGRTVAQVNNTQYLGEYCKQTLDKAKESLEITSKDDEKYQILEEYHKWADQAKTEMHLFEGDYAGPTISKETGEQPGGQLPTMLAIKHKNKGSKLDSHQWFFTFTEEYQRESGGGLLVFLIDAGTEASKGSLAMMVRELEWNPKLGGVCGEIAIDRRTDIKEGQDHLSNVIIAAQKFEYKTSHLLDKAFESRFGYISVLPGAFSGYRLSAINHDRNDTAQSNVVRATPLETYCHSIQESAGEETVSITKGNMYLAEDRILGFEMLTRPGKAWQMKYVKGAVGNVDPVPDLKGLINQRRRWLNGSFFASWESLVHYPGRMMLPGSRESTTHNCWQRVCLTFEFLYYFLTIIVTLLLVSLFYLTIHYSLSLTFPNSGIIVIFTWVYLGLLAVQMVVSLGDKMARSKFAANFMMSCYTVAMHVMGCGMYGIIFLTVYQMYRIGYEGQNDVVLGGHEKFSCKRNFFNEHLLNFASAGSFCFGDKVESAKYFSDIRDHFREACYDPNDHWELVLANSSTGAYTVESASKAEGCVLDTRLKVVIALTSVCSFFIIALVHDIISTRAGCCRFAEVRVLVSTFFQYMYLLPTFVNIIMVYAFCNLHDLSWGTKGLTGGAEKDPKKAGEDYQLWRTGILLAILLVNGAFVNVCIAYVDGACFLTSLAYFTGVYNGMKMVLSIIYALDDYQWRRRNMAKIRSQRIRNGYSVPPYESPAAGAVAGDNFDYNHDDHDHRVEKGRESLDEYVNRLSMDVAAQQAVEAEERAMQQRQEQGVQQRQGQGQGGGAQQDRRGSLSKQAAQAMAASNSRPLDSTSLNQHLSAGSTGLVETWDI